MNDTVSEIKSVRVLHDVLAAAKVLVEATGGSRGEIDWHFGRIRAMVDGLFARAPFHVGDRVILTKTPEITEEKSWGWLGSKHFLVEGAEATVSSVDFHDGLFSALLYFDDETWIDRTNGGVKCKPTTPALYGFSERWLRKVDSAGEESKHGTVE